MNKEMSMVFIALLFFGAITLDAREAPSRVPERRHASTGSQSAGRTAGEVLVWEWTTDICPYCGFFEKKV